jgi:hypothetical protein
MLGSVLNQLGFESSAFRQGDGKFQMSRRSYETLQRDFWFGALPFAAKPHTSKQLGLV